MKELLLFLSLLCFVVGCNACTEAEQVAHEEFGPRAALKKYEWFKDVAAQLEKKKADIKVYKAKLVDMEQSYEGVARKDWDRTDKQTHAQWQAEIAGTIASYNTVAADYNSQMAKFNWRFANKGDLPQGASEPLPREFKPYMEE